MFKSFFKKVSTGVQTLVEPSKDMSEVIAEIHNEFDTATEKLLNRAKEILANEKDTTKGERLDRLGFKSSKPAKEKSLDTSLKMVNKQLADNIEYFSQWYPNQKFITEEIVKEICKKYGLVFGLAYWYAADVPEKNIQEMEGFIFREEDGKKTTIYEKIYENGSKAKLYWKLNEYGRGDYVIAPLDKMVGDYVIERPPYMICAPISDFDEYYIKNYCRVEEGYKLEANLVDPIVLQPVNGGYLIVTKWGLEASDEIVVNEKMN
jgi:hypothetical protein